jgi:hypothetical protein
MKLTCKLLDGIIQRTKEPSLPGRRRLLSPSRILALIALSSRPYVVPGSASTALMKLSVMAPIEDDSSENPCTVIDSENRDGDERSGALGSDFRGVRWRLRISGRRCSR